MIQSPLNYTGGKFKLLPQILPLFPNNINTFVDLFCGGCNVGINVESKSVIYNDVDENLLYLYNTFKNLDKRSVYNKEKFLKLRTDFNEKKKRGNYDYYYYVMLYVIIVYAFNNQIRFNSNGEFNLPVGKRDFNKKMQQKLSDFIDKIKEQDCKFTCLDFREFDVEILGNDDFVYVDPPYLITCATYNEQGGWSETDERDLLTFLNKLHEKKLRFALSNVLRSKGKENTILLEWLSENKEKYKAINLDYNYSNSNYQTKDKTANSEEVLVINY